ncbi:MAG: flavodoxin family protein, partial [Deltaproteobacteria bacterium]
CMALEGKYAAIVETSGGGGDEEVIDYMSRFVNSLGANSVGGVGSPIAGIRVFPNETELYSKARALGRELCRCIKDKQAFPAQEAFLNEFRQRMSGLVDFMKEYWVFEHDFWAKKRASH